MAKAKTKTARRKRVTQKRAEQNGHVQDGQIEIHVQGGPHDGKTIHMDAIVVKLAAEELDNKHKLKVEDGRTIPTAAFAQDLSKSLEAMGYDSTPTIAMHAWAKACEYFVETQKKTS